MVVLRAVAVVHLHQAPARGGDRAFSAPGTPTSWYTSRAWPLTAHHFGRAVAVEVVEPAVGARHLAVAALGLV